MAIMATQEAYVVSRFDRLVERFKPTVGADDFRLQAIRAALPSLAGLRVLDLGCGQGRFAERLAVAGACVLGVDPSGAMLGRATERIDRVRGSARRLPFRDGAFDAVLLIEVLEHVPDAGLEGVLGEVFRVLRPAGRLVVIDKNAGSLDPNRPYLPALAVKRLDEARGRWMYPPGAPVRERWFWPGRLASRLERSGLAGVGYRYLLSPGEASSAVFRRLVSSRRYVVWTGLRPPSDQGMEVGADEE